MISFSDENSNANIDEREQKEVEETSKIGMVSRDVYFAEIICLFGITIYVCPYAAIPTGFFGIIAFFFRRFYLKTSRSIKRLEGTTKSPIFSQLSSSLNGLVSIRAFNAEDKMVNEFDYHQDIHSSAFFLTLGTTKLVMLSFDFNIIIHLK